MWGIVRREATDAMRHPGQMLLAPWISVLIFIFVFGYVLGSRLPPIAGQSYLKFLLPGLVMMDVVTVSFAQSSGDLYFARFQRYVQEMLVSPLSYFEMMAGSLVVAVLRALVTAVGILVMGAVFGGLSIISLWEFGFWIVAVAIIFALLGMIVGLWADNFEQLGALPKHVRQQFLAGGVHKCNRPQIDMKELRATAQLALPAITQFGHPGPYQSPFKPER